MAAQTPLDENYSERMKEQVEAMLRHLQGIHEHPGNSWYTECRHPMPYRGIAMDPG